MKSLKWLKLLIAFLVVTAGVMVCNNALDNDSWYILAEGREIVENGVYYEDQLSMHEGLEVTVQNYGFAAIFYLLYSSLGPVGIYIIMLILNLLLVHLIYKVCVLISDKNINLSLILAVLTDLLLARWFIVTRAQMVSYLILMLLIYLLELYIKTGKSKNLWWIPALSVVQINLHASLWPIIFLVMGTYIIDSFKNKKLHLQGYKKKSLFIIFVVSLFVGFLNPYGFKMMMFIFSSYGIPEANNYISELTSFNLGDNFNILLYGVIAIVMLLYIFGRKQNIRMRWLLMTFGFLALGLNTVKGMSHLILVLLFPLAAVYKDVLIEHLGTRKMRWMVASWAGILAATLIVTVAVVRLPQAIDGPSEKMIAAVDKLDEDTKNMSKDDLKVYVGFDNGGFLEYRGYKSYIDPRMEVFLKANNGKEDIFKEFYDLTKAEIKLTDFLKKYDFDYMVVMDYEHYLSDFGDLGENYELIYNTPSEDKDGEDDESGVKVYKKIKNVV